MEDHLKVIFPHEKITRLDYGVGGGCISEGSSYAIGGRKIFVKSNNKQGVYNILLWYYYYEVIEFFCQIIYLQI